MAVQWGLLDPDMAAKIGGSFQQGQRNALAMQGAQQEQQINAFKMQQAQQEAQSQNALSEAYRSSGGDMAKLKENLLAGGHFAPAMQLSKMEAEQQKEGLAAKKLELETHVNKMEVLGRIFSTSHDQASHDANLQEAASMFGEDSIQNVPKIYNPTELGFVLKKAESVKDQKYNEIQRNNQVLREMEIANTGGYQKAQLAQGEERIGLQERQLGMQEQAAQSKAMEEKPLPAAQQAQLIGASNTMDAIKEYRTELKNFSKLDLVNPDARSSIDNKFQNMLMQAKEVYKLGALTGPDQSVLEKIITNPASFKGSIVSQEAMDKQAEDLSRLMSKAGKTAAMGKEQLLQKLDESTAPVKGIKNDTPSDWTPEEEAAYRRQYGD